ncbi:hypothetical protein PI124_g24201 [Phytophthora idaei]|nr:hypothetical protein PI124_g24201 [Phytophthora idaei]
MPFESVIVIADRSHTGQRVGSKLCAARAGGIATHRADEVDRVASARTEIPSASACKQGRLMKWSIDSFW